MPCDRQTIGTRMHVVPTIVVPGKQQYNSNITKLLIAVIDNIFGWAENFGFSIKQLLSTSTGIAQKTLLIEHYN